MMSKVLLSFSWNFFPFQFPKIHVLAAFVRRHEAELAAAASQLLPDDDDDAFE
jgi:hypothetical protein